jgi:ATP-binding cassette subfamily C protein CydD
VDPADGRLLRKARAARLALGVDVCLGVVAALLVLAQAVLIGSVVAATFSGEGPRSLVVPLVLLVVVVAGRSAANWGFETVGGIAATRVVSQLRMEMVGAHVRRRPDDRDRAAELATLAVAGASAIESLFARYIPQLVLAIVVPVTVLVLVAYLDLVTAGLLLLTLPLVPMFMWLLGHAAAEQNRRRWQALAVLATHFSDVVRGLPTLRAFNRGTIQARRIAEVSDEYRGTTMETLRLSFLSGAVLELAATLGVALVAVTVGVRLIDGTISFAPGLIVLLLAPELYVPLRSLGAHYHASAEGRAVVRRLLDLAEAPNAGARSGAADPRSKPVSFEGICFSFPDRPGMVLDSVDLEIRPGEMVALVGPSGAGKSTIAALLLLMAEPLRGRIMVGDTDLAVCDPAAWRAQIAWVPQHPTLFRGSVAANVRLGNPSADSGQLRAACRLAGAERFIAQLPDGYDTVIGDGGRPLSAGQRQRIALARAFLRDAPLLVLDEPTAHLDFAGVQRVITALETLHGRQTILLITHQDETASVADLVLRVEGGRIVSHPLRPGAARTA